MKLRSLMAAAFVSVSAVSAFAMTPLEVLRDHSENKQTMVTAHRADWRKFPENSLPAMESAIESGALILELDFKKTEDGEIIVLHDGSIDRTTDGSGSVSSMTLEEIKKYNLRQFQGGETEVTEFKVPTLREAIELARGRALIYLDHGWGIRDEIYDVLLEMDAVDMGIFNSFDDPRIVKEFLSRDENILYMHKINKNNHEHAFQFGDYFPDAWILQFGHYAEPHVEPGYVEDRSQETRIWYDTLWYGLTPDLTDERSHLDGSGWEILTEHYHGSIFQTDDIRALVHWLEHGETEVAHLIKVMTADYGREGPGRSYYDTTETNQGGHARVHEGVDFCDKNTSIVMCYIREGEWVKYDFTIPQSGMYNVYARLSSRQENAGEFSLTFNDSETLHTKVMNTSSHTLLMQQKVGEVYLTEGAHQMTFRVEPSANTNFDVHYFGFEPQFSPDYDYVYPAGLGSYQPGTVVLGEDNELYECRPFPNAGWCNQAPDYYAPGTGSNWRDAWIRQ